MISVHFGRKPNRKRVCGSLNRTSQNHYVSEPNPTGTGQNHAFNVKSTCLCAGKLKTHLNNDRSIYVAVKMLKEDVSSRATRDNFEREVKTISSFDHENLLHLIGVVALGTRAAIY